MLRFSTLVVLSLCTLLGFGVLGCAAPTLPPAATDSPEPIVAVGSATPTPVRAVSSTIEEPVPGPTDVSSPAETPAATREATPPIEPASAPATRFAPVPTTVQELAATPVFTTIAISVPQDALTDNDLSAQRILEDIQRKNPTAHEIFSGYSWLTDGVSDDELLATSYLAVINERLAVTDPSMVENIFGSLPWLEDGVTPEDVLFLGYYSTVSAPAAIVASLLARDVSSLPEPERLDLAWAEGDLTYTEWQALHRLNALIRAQPHIADSILELPWINGDSLTEKQLGALAHLQES